ncbi:MAG: arginine--tRNA ligase [Candidatus Abyssobacteria bacterium SURF_5]|uniref:Arginine--tRNA ligase n=1 Tax=Abyssobacteria bacterium (strain SURF_5) TaxID=2093360 RepID=A0A3A4NEJ5_ABYX5|nr:MAG: arginine--tRNA ligase [Candidatus Abyssubacteria bacterium SURF_5]
MEKEIESKIKAKIAGAIEKAIEDGSVRLDAVPEIRLETPNNPEHGDYATNVSLQLARLARTAPMKIADAVVRHIEVSDELFEKVVVAAPGFINFYLKDRAVAAVISQVLSAGDTYGSSRIGAGKRVNVEFVSSNPTGPLTIGHGRQATLGDVLSNCLTFCGYDVTREYYYNDAGKQMDMLARSVHARYQQLFDPSSAFPDEGYQGDYIRDVAEDIRKQEGDKYVGKDDQATIDFFRQFAVREMIALIDRDLKYYGVRFDMWSLESALYSEGKVERALKLLEEHGFLYEQEGALWFRSSALGDEKDRVVRRSNGALTYFAGDIAYHVDKHERGFDRAIDIWGADHHGYVPRMMAVIKALGYPDDFLECIVHQMVSFVRDGKEIKMSTRAGQFVTLYDLVHEVGLPVTRFFFLMRSYDSHLVFDFDLAKKESSENPVYYIQYAHARISSINKHAESKGFDLDRNREADLSLLKEPEEVDLMKYLSKFPSVVEAAAEKREVHRIPAFILEVVGLFHAYYNKHIVVSDNEQLSLARLALVEAVRQVVKNALHLLGIEAPERM